MLLANCHWLFNTLYAKKKIYQVRWLQNEASDKYFEDLKVWTDPLAFFRLIFFLFFRTLYNIFKTLPTTKLILCIVSLSRTLKKIRV